MAKRLKLSGLGIIVMYSLSDKIHISIQDFRERAHKYNVPLTLLPNMPRDSSVFRKATTAITTKISMREEPILCKEIGDNPETIVRTFEKRIVDSEQDISNITNLGENVPVYKHIATMVFHKRDSSIEHAILHPIGKEIVDNAFRNYNQMSNFFGIKEARATIQSAFKMYGSISLRHNGGVNFIPETYCKEWKNFSDFIESFEGVEVVELAVFNNSHNRAEIHAAFNSNVIGSLEEEIIRLGGKSQGSKKLTELVADFSVALHSGKQFRRETLLSMARRFKDTADLVKAYRDLLGTDMSILDSQMGIARQQINQLLSRASGDEEMGG